MDWLGDVLEGLGAPIFNVERYLAAGMIEKGLGNADAAGLSQPFEARGDIHSVTVNIIAVDYDVAQVDANAELDTLIRGFASIALTHPLLQFDGATRRIYHAGKFDQSSVARCLDHAAPMFGDLGID